MCVVLNCRESQPVIFKGTIANIVDSTTLRHILKIPDFIDPSPSLAMSQAMQLHFIPLKPNCLIPNKGNPNKLLLLKQESGAGPKTAIYILAQRSSRTNHCRLQYWLRIARSTKVSPGFG